MRLQRWAWLAVLALGAAGEANAQNPNPISPSALTGVSPSSVQFTPINLSNATMPAVPPLNPASTNWFNLTNFFRKMPSISLPMLGSSNIPAPNFTTPFAPLPPINSTVPVFR